MLTQCLTAQDPQGAPSAPPDPDRQHRRGPRPANSINARPLGPPPQRQRRSTTGLVPARGPQQPSHCARSGNSFGYTHPRCPPCTTLPRLQSLPKPAAIHPALPLTPPTPGRHARTRIKENPSQGHIHVPPAAAGLSPKSPLAGANCPICDRRHAKPQESGGIDTLRFSQSMP
jgi:hypothetical protein